MHLSRNLNNDKIDPQAFGPDFKPWGKEELAAMRGKIIGCVLLGDAKTFCTQAEGSASMLVTTLHVISFYTQAALLSSLEQNVTLCDSVEASEADLAEVALHEDAMLRRCEDPREQQRRLATAWLSVKSRRKSSSQPRQKRS